VQVIALWAEISTKFSKVDVLVNNAGIGGSHTKIGGGKMKEWLEVQVGISNHQTMFCGCLSFWRSKLIVRVLAN
jgi:NADP-dependent 3-hydroxy acid dehydrogenase YdfG